MVVDSKKIAEQISNAVKQSPAYTQRPEAMKIADAVKSKDDEGALMAALRREQQVPQEQIGALTEALQRGVNQEQGSQVPEVPLIELGDVYGVTGSVKSAISSAKHSGPIDKSKGVSFDEDGVATQKIATDRVLGTEGAGDYAQYTYDNLDERWGAASAGVNEDDVYVRNLRAGNAGLNIATSSELNPMDGSDGNPAMFSRRYPKLNTTVEPFKVRIPNYNLEVMSQTLDPEKLAYQIATNIGGKPVTPYVGYTNVGFDITEPWYSTLTKGIGRAPIALASMAGKATVAIPFIAAALESALEAGGNALSGVDRKTTRDILMRELQSIADDYDSIAGPWNEAYDSMISYLGLKNTSKADGVATLVGEVPTVLGQIGMLYGIGALAAGTGLTLESSIALTNVIGGGVFGLAQGAEEFEELGRKGVNPIVRFRNAGIGTAGSIALNSLGLFSVFGSKLSAARQFMQNYGARMTAAGVAGGVIGAAGEGLTEWGDQYLQDLVTYNMGDDQAAARLSNRTIAFALGAIGGGLVGVPANIRNERIQIAREEIKKAQIRANAPQWLKELDTAVKMIAGEGVYTKEQALDMLIGMASPEGQRFIKQKQNDTLMGLLDRMSPEAVEYVKDIGARQSAKAIETLNKIDQQTFDAIPDSVDIQTRTMVARAMKALAPLIEFNGGRFRMPNFVVRPNQPMAYERATNTLYINPNSTGESVDLPYVRDKSLPLLDPVQRGILHELGHMVDSQLGRGTNYKEFFPAYFEAIAKVFGNEKATAVKKAMPNPENRLEYDLSQKKKDVTEKQIDKLTGKINDKNTAEYFAYAIGRLGRRVGRAFGFDAAQSAQYVDAANVLAMTLHIPQITNQLTAYQNAMNTLIKNNDDTLAAMAKAAGNEGLSRKIQDYASGKTDALSKEDVVALYNILKSYVGVDGMKILDEAFSGVTPETFMQRAEREFKQSIRHTGHTVGELQTAIQKKQGAAMETNPGEANEQVVYTSTPVPLEGEHLDVDKYYGTGEANNNRGGAMRWGYGNYGNKSPDLNKRYYYDKFSTRAAKNNDSFVIKDIMPQGRIRELYANKSESLIGVYDWASQYKGKNKNVSISNVIDGMEELETSYAKQADQIERSILKTASSILNNPDNKNLSEWVRAEMAGTRTHVDLGGISIPKTEAWLVAEIANRTSFWSDDTDVSPEAKGVFLELTGDKEKYQRLIDDINKYGETTAKGFYVRSDIRYLKQHVFEDAILNLEKQQNLEPHQYAFLIPDKEYYLDAQKPISQQTQYVRDRIQQVADKYDYRNSDYMLNPGTGAFDIDVDDLTGEEVYDWLAYTIYPETINVMPRDFDNIDKVDANRFARDVLADTGIKGMMTVGGRDKETYNTFRSEDTKKYKQIREDTFDISGLLDKKPRVSTLEKRVAEKPTGSNYEIDVKNVADIMKKSGKAPRWFTRMFGGGDMNTALWGMGGQKLVDYFGMIPKMNRATDAATGYMTEFDNIVKKELGFKNNIERDAFMNEASIDSIPVDYMIDPLTGDPISMNISPLVAMNVYLHSLNPKTRDNMLNAFGGNGDQMQRVIDALTPEQKKYADIMQKFVADNWKKYKKSYEQEGEDLEDEPYWPVVEAIHAAVGERKTNSNISRKGDRSYAISMEVDAREVFNTYVQRVAGAENNVYSTIRRMKDLFGYSKNEATDDYPTSEREALSNKMWDNSRRLRGMATQNFGDARRIDQFLELLDDFLARREQTQVGSEALNIAARNLTAGLLQWKPIQFIKNLSNATGYFGGVPEGGQAQYWRDTAWAATHPIEAKNYMFDKVPFLRNRFQGQNVDEALTQQTAGDDSLLMNWAKKKKNMSKEGQTVVSNLVALTQAARRLGYTPMLAGDASANIVGGYGLLKQYEAKYGDQAADKFAEFVVNHQTSSNQATRSLLQRRWSRDIRGELTRFATEQVQKAKSIGTAIAQAQRGERTTLSAAKEIASTLSSIIIFSLISAGVIDLFDGDEENDKDVYEAMAREGISAIVGASVIGNSVIAPIVDSLFFGTSGGMGTPASKIVMSDLRKLSKGDFEDAIFDSIGATIPLVGAKTFVSEAKGTYRAVTAKDSKELKAGVYQALGRSQNYAEERAGIKKSTK